jgi:hypothetical protein
VILSELKVIVSMIIDQRRLFVEPLKIERGEINEREIKVV